MKRDWGEWICWQMNPLLIFVFGGALMAIVWLLCAAINYFMGRGFTV